jgi:hypothetical protein
MRVSGHRRKKPYLPLKTLALTGFWFLKNTSDKLNDRSNPCAVVRKKKVKQSCPKSA